MATEKKINKKEKYLILLDILEQAQEVVELDEECGVTYDDLMTLVKNEVSLLDKKAEKSKELAAAKREESDALTEKIFDVLVEDEYTVIDEIVELINDVNVTRNMVTYRLGKLFQAGRVEKDQVTVEPATEEEKPRKATAYRKVTM